MACEGRAAQTVTRVVTMTAVDVPTADYLPGNRGMWLTTVLRPAGSLTGADVARFGAALRAWLGDAELRERLRRAARERRESLPGWATTTSVLARVLAEASR